jgi:hypothetical protein
MADEYDDDLDGAIETALEHGERNAGGELDDLGAEIAAGGGDIDEHESDDAPAPQYSGGGGDIDDDPFRLQAEHKKREATTIHSQWKDEFKRREDALKDAQDKYRAAKKKAMDSDEYDDEELAASEAVMAARYQLDKARDSLGQAEQYVHHVETASQVPQAQREWLSSNPKVAADPRLLSQAKSIFRQVRDAGYDPSHPAFYREMDKRMTQTPRMGGNTARRQSGVAPAVHTDRRSDRGSRISPKEAEFIRKLGRDPKNPEHAAQWVESKKNTLRIAKARGFL